MSSIDSGFGFETFVLDLRFDFSDFNVCSVDFWDDLISHDFSMYILLPWVNFCSINDCLISYLLDYFGLLSFIDSKFYIPGVSLTSKFLILLYSPT